MTSDDWCVTVFKCKSNVAETYLVEFYNFLKDLDGVKDLHFIIRDRVDDEVVFSFRVLTDPKYKEVIESKLAYKLRALASENRFAINPSGENPLAKYVAWSSNDRIAKYGVEKFAVFCGFLSQLSKMVIDMAEKKYFDSNERVEIAHVMSWMLGCTKYGLLSKKHMEIGYYDRITDKSHVYLKESFIK